MVLGSIIQKKKQAVSYTWSEITATGLPSRRDGAFGFNFNGIDYICAGWNGGYLTYNDFYKSVDGGVTWTTLADAPFTPRHTVATIIRPEGFYTVGGDVFGIINDGVYARDSYKFDLSGWVLKAENSGIGNRALMGAAYHNGAFYLCGGQTSRYIADGSFTSTLKSVNECASFSGIGTHDFPGGNLWGSLVSFQGKLWKICGGVYDDADIADRTYPLAIYSSPDGVTWTNWGNFPGTGRQYHQTIVFDGYIWVIGGYNNFSGYNLGDVWKFDGTTWTQVESNATWDDRHAHTCWISRDRILMYGGTTDGTATVSEIWQMTKNYT